jgi:hypothetical protein
MSFQIPPYRDPLREVASGFEGGMNAIAQGLLRSRESKETRDAEARAQASGIINQSANEIARLRAIDNPSEDVATQIQRLEEMAQEAQGLLSLARPGDATAAWGNFSQKHNIAGALGQASGVAQQATRTQTELQSVRDQNMINLNNVFSFLQAGVRADDPNFVTNLNINLRLLESLASSGFNLPAGGEERLQALVAGLQGTADTLANDPRYQEQVSNLRAISNAAAQQAGLNLQLTQEQINALAQQTATAAWAHDRDMTAAPVRDAASAANLFAEAAERGDVAFLNNVLMALNDPDHPQHEWYKAAGVTPQQIEAAAALAAETLDIMGLNREVARATLATAREKTAEEMRDLTIRAYGRDGLDDWFNNLSPQEQQRLGGRQVLNGMKVQAEVYELGVREPLRAEAWNRVNNILSLPVPSAQDGSLTFEGQMIMQERVQQIYEIMAPQFGENYSQSFTSGAMELLGRNAQAWEWEALKTNANLGLIQAQTWSTLRSAGLDQNGNPIPANPMTMVDALAKGIAAMETVRRGTNEELSVITAGLEANGCNPSAMPGTGARVPGATSDVCQGLRTQLGALTARMSYTNGVVDLFGNAIARAAVGELLPEDFRVMVGEEEGDPFDGGGAGGFTSPVGASGGVSVAGGGQGGGGGGVPSASFGGQGGNGQPPSNIEVIPPVPGAMPTDAVVPPRTVTLSPEEQARVARTDSTLLQGATRIAAAIPQRDVSAALQATTNTLRDINESALPLTTRPGSPLAQPTSALTPEQAEAGFNLALGLARGLGFRGSEPEIISALNTFARNNYDISIVSGAATPVRGMNVRVNPSDLKRLAELLQGTLNTVSSGATSRDGDR